MHGILQEMHYILCSGVQWKYSAGLLTTNKLPRVLTQPCCPLKHCSDGNHDILTNPIMSIGPLPSAQHRLVSYRHLAGSVRHASILKRWETSLQRRCQSKESKNNNNFCALFVWIWKWRCDTKWHLSTFTDEIGHASPIKGISLFSWLCLWDQKHLHDL